MSTNANTVKRTFVTFGQDHKHTINGVNVNKDCVAIVNGDRDKVFELFGPEFCFEYPEEYWDDSRMHYFPNGYVEIPKESAKMV